MATQHATDAPMVQHHEVRGHHDSPHCWGVKRQTRRVTHIAATRMGPATLWYHLSVGIGVPQGVRRLEGLVVSEDCHGVRYLKAVV